MIRVRRSADVPPSLAAARDGCWREPDVKAALYACFLGKCYLCEGPLGRGAMEVDHRVPQGDPTGVARRYDWENLFPAHHDCNNRRSRSYPDGGLLFPDKDDVQARLDQQLVALGGRYLPRFLHTDMQDSPAKNTAGELNNLHVVPNPEGRGFDKADDLRNAIERHLNVVLVAARAYDRALKLHGPAALETRVAESDLRHLLSRSAPYTMLIRSVVPDLSHLFD